MLAVDETGAALDGDQILAVLALALGVDTVAVTTMTNLGFHRLMAEHGIRVLTTDVGDRYVLEALRAEGAVLGGEQSGHVISLDGHVTGDGLAAALLLCGALGGRPLSEAAAVLEAAAGQARTSASRPGRSARSSDEVERLEAELGGRGRILVRPSGTEPLVRILVEAEDEDEADALCGQLPRSSASSARRRRTRPFRLNLGMLVGVRRGDERSHAACVGSSDTSGPGSARTAALRPRAARVPRLRLRGDRAPRGGRPALHPRGREPAEPEARRR